MTELFSDGLLWLQTWAVNTGMNIIYAGIIIVVGWWLVNLATKAVKRIIKNKNVDQAAASFLISVIRTILFGLVILVAISNIINISNMVAALGAAGLTASFALQGTLGNFISGVQLVFSKPFKIGDYLTIGGNSGTVKSISILNTILLTVDNKEVVIPNSSITSGVVINYSTQENRRLDLTYSISYTSDIAKVKEVLAAVVNADERILKEPSAIIAVDSHGESSVNMAVKVWVLGADYWNVYFDMQEKVKLAFDENGIEIPFQQIVVHNAEKK